MRSIFLDIGGLFLRDSSEKVVLRRQRQFFFFRRADDWRLAAGLYGRDDASKLGCRVERATCLRERDVSTVSERERWGSVVLSSLMAVLA